MAQEKPVTDDIPPSFTVPERKTVELPKQEFD
jgi:hypothetical protein